MRGKFQIPKDLILLGTGILLLLALITILFTFDTTESDCTTGFDKGILYVGGSGPNNYTKIQDAIDGASNGDTVYVYNGIYEENIVVDKAISLVGQGVFDTVVDGNNKTNTIVIAEDGVSVTNFTVKNGSENSAGIKINSDDNKLFYCNISNNNGDGIIFSSVHNNTITDVIINNNRNRGAFLHNSFNNKITHLELKYNYKGITLSNSEDNTISFSIISKNEGEGIMLSYSDKNTISANYISSNTGMGTWLDQSTGNTIKNNYFYEDGIYLSGKEVSHFTQDVKDNKVNGKQLCYIKNDASFVVPSNAGQVILTNCSDGIIEGGLIEHGDIGIEIAYSDNITIRHSKILSADRGIYMYFTSKNKVTDSVISNTDHALTMELSVNNTITGCTISSNRFGIQLLHSNNNNSVYHNNFINNEINVLGNGNNEWDDGTEGNYWDDYSGVDENNDGIGDTPYAIGEDAKDNYPLMEPIETKEENEIPGFEFISFTLAVYLLILWKRRKK